MPISDHHPRQSLCSGDAAEFGHLSEVQDLIEQFLRSSLPAIVPNLHIRKDGKTGRRNEKAIAADLCKDLNSASAGDLFYFFPEDPQNETVTRTSDMGMYPRSTVNVGGHALGGRDCLYCIEAKLLPTPYTNMEDRSREYVVGRWESKGLAHKSHSGGIERFKEMHHAAELGRAGMFGFVQSEDFNHWHGEVNLWIDDLIAAPIPSHQAKWKAQDHLRKVGSHGSRIDEFHSDHNRSDGTTIQLSHFWLDLTAA